MCPLRIILIFLSATLAGFFVLRNLKSSPEFENDAVKEETDSSDSVPLSSKVCTALGKGFWSCVDMASGKYLWRNLVSSTAKISAD
ncbi:Methyltransferase-related protein [Perilla frutescens var. hirtella]|uniref:Methyltransferase-related protein n=1 Tax=Perilla frutescens var. hirtella TaxID=608512 RepID=A0AAD4PEK5_PERFH|nr:Methyltransferase-related protein [Perilla frutescens var. hirtella]KAH6810859.1 Methyltransferase-related protein [Perilla frutescens var. frutescens]KAH6814205.1 Methyltransferase-related protein [Perilla frutescens var. frutescens]KAH6837068.1 Methyltransferase-related protein [Perilla frutescens var. hirtella]